MDKRLKYVDLEERVHGKPLGQHLREFGLLSSVFFSAVSLYVIWKPAKVSLLALVWLAAAAVFLFITYQRPTLLYYPWKGWMRFASLFARVINPVVLFLIWVFAVIPTAFLLRLCGKRVMDLRFRAPGNSYWEDRVPEQNDFQLLRKQY